MTGQPAYTDAEVGPLAEFLLREYDSEHDVSHLSWQDFAAQARAILDAVAPAIAARALREAATEWGGRIVGTDSWRGATVAAELLERADEIEAGR